MQEVRGQMNTMEANEMMNTMSEGKVEKLNLIRGECQDTRDLSMEDKRELIYTKLKQTLYINNKGKPTFYIINGNKACIST